MSTRTVGPTFFPPLGPAKMSGGLEPKGWDRAVLAGQVLPAYCNVLRGGVVLKRDPKKKSGADGSNPVYHGLDPQPLELEATTYSDDDREALAGIIASLMPVPDRKLQPVSFDHPAVRHLGIANVAVIGVGALIPIGPGVAKMMIQLEHWMPPKSKSKSATTTPTRAVRNAKREAARKAKPPNPAPTAQPSMGKPPAFTGAT